MKFSSAALMLYVSLPAATALADARINYRATEGGGASIASFLIGHGKLRTDTHPDVGSSVIIDPASETMIILNHDDREFMRMGRKEIEQMGTAINAAMAQMEAAMANMPPEMREQMQGMMGGAMPGGDNAIKMDATGRNDTVAGYRCQIYQTRMGGDLVNETCMGDVALFDELSAADRQTLEQALAMTQRLTETLSSGPLGQMVDMSTFHAGMLPLRVSDYDGGKRSTAEFSGIDDAPLPADLFAVPAGYKQQKLEVPGL